MTIADPNMSLKKLRDQLLLCNSLEQKLKVLPYHHERETLSLSPDLQLVFESLFAIGQGERIFYGVDFHQDQEKILQLLNSLLPVEEFYQPIGGIVGYHVKFLELLAEKRTPPKPHLKRFEAPPGVHLTEETKDVRKSIREGIEAMEEMAEIYPIAGAADRLDLKDPKTQEPLPAAALNFLGFTLLEGLIRDLIGREYLYFKLTANQTTLPLVLMTSHEKNNATHVKKILDDNQFFHRPQNQFFLINQPLVPVISSEGEWVIKEPLTLALKPGGHGALWRLLQEPFKSLKTMGRTKALIRQINNPVAGVDHGLLAFCGIGCGQHKVFGFASCERCLGSEEGMDVLVEERINGEYQTTITNVEYTDFAKQGIQDCPETPESPYSCFPANTNILFADLEAIEKTIASNPFPGLLINFKAESKVGRLESTMQNIADFLSVKSPNPLIEKEKRELPVFVTYNLRRKTLIATKKGWKEGMSLRDTPDGAFLEVMKNGKELLESCGFQVSQELLFTYHPALGPLYSVIRQKLKNGILHPKAELKLEIAELFIDTLHLEGSLLIQADQVTGHLDPGSLRHYSHQTGKCILQNVAIQNKGVHSSNWKYEVERLESVTIHIEGNGEFFAKDVTFQGNYHIIVPANHRMVAIQKYGDVNFLLEPIEQPSWKWHYHFNAEDEIVLHL